MKIAVMQPYLFPYLGYFQLIKAVDTFVFFDDVNYINKGWINRNNILVNGDSHLFTLPLKKASQNKLINEIEIADYDSWRKDFFQKLQLNYKKSPCYDVVFNWLNATLGSTQYSSLSKFLTDSVTSTSDFMGLKTKFLLSSEMNYRSDEVMKGQEKVLSICKLLNALTYINPKSGQDLYDKENFSGNNMDLQFILMKDIEYAQFKNKAFVPNLSILDVLMFNGPEKTAELLCMYDLK